MACGWVRRKIAPMAAATPAAGHFFLSSLFVRNGVAVNGKRCCC
jgi:hypothetical protein